MSEGQVLLVDDDLDFLTWMRAALASEPVTLHATTSAEAALEVLRQRRIDVVLSDQHMPNMKGTDFLAEVAREFPATARLILTGHPALDLALDAINHGQVCQFLEKPCAPDQLCLSVRQALHLSKKNQAADLMLSVARHASADRQAPSTPKTVRSSAAERPLAAELAALSVRQREVAELIIAGERVAEVASKLHLSEYTVRNHVKAIFRVLGVRSQLELRKRYR